MIVCVYAIYDDAAQEYGAPTLFKTDKLATRWFINLITSSKEMMDNYEDYKLYRIGNYFSDQAEFENIDHELIVDSKKIMELMKNFKEGDYEKEKR